MSQGNINSLNQIFAPPPAGSAVTTQQMQQQVLFALMRAGLGQTYVQNELPLLEQAKAGVDANIDINPVTASAMLRIEQEALENGINAMRRVWDDTLTPPGPGSELTNYRDAVNAWYENMTGGAAYEPLDQWPSAVLSNYPNLASAIQNGVAFANFPF